MFFLNQLRATLLFLSLLSSSLLLSATSCSKGKRILVSVLDIPLKKPPFWAVKFGDRLAENKKAYAKSKGYDYFVGRENLFPYAHHIWSKFKYNLVKLDEGYDLIFNIDSDAKVMNMSVTLEDIDQKIVKLCGNYSVAKAKDVNGFNSGVYILKNTQITRDILIRALSHINNTALPRRSLFEQSAFSYVVNNNTTLKSQVCVVPQNWFNSYPECEGYAGKKYSTGDFILHFVNTGKKLIEKFF